MINTKVNNIESGKEDEIIFWNQLKEGKRIGLEGLFNKFSHDLFKYGMAVLADRNLIKDCIQELFIDLWKYRQSLNATNNVKVYLCRSLSNRIFREVHLEKRRRGHNLVDVHDFLNCPGGMDHFSENQQMEDEVNFKLLNAMENLPNRQKEIIQHVFFNKLTREEISLKMGIAVQSVYTLTWKAISKLKKSFK